MLARRAKLWIAADGTRTPLCHLSNSHLTRIVRMMRRRAAESRGNTADTIDQILTWMDEDSFGYDRYAAAQARVATQSVESFAAAMYDRNAPYASYQDLTDEAVERELLDVFGSHD